jgi:hypothetical protein
MSANLAERPSQAIEYRGMLDIPGFHFSPTGLKIDDWVSFEEWMQAGVALQIAGKAIQWYLGDWLAHGQGKWGEKYAQVVDAHDKTGIPINTLRDYQYVAERVPIAVRTANVDWSTHREVAELEPERQKAVLKKAASDTDKWTKRAVKRYVETGLEPGETSGINASAIAHAASLTLSDEMRSIGVQAMMDFLQSALQTIIELKNQCPRPKFAADVLESWQDEINDHLEQLSLDALKDKVIKAWRDGYREESQIARMTGIPSSEIHGVMMAYKRDGLFEKVIRSKTKMAKGTCPWIWHLTGEPLGSNYEPSHSN